MRISDWSSEVCSADMVTIADHGGSWTHTGGASVDYLRNRAQTQEQAFEGEYEAQYDLDHRHFSYGLARYEYDRFSGFDYEFTAAAGLGRHLVREPGHEWRSEEHTSELQSLMRISYAVFCLKKKKVHPTIDKQ